MHGHKKGHCKEFVKSLDIFGTSVDFSFKNSHSFGTCGGFCLSILIVAFMIFYTIMIIIDTTKYSKPFVLTSYTEITNLDVYNIEPDYPSLFDVKNSITLNKTFSSNTKFNAQFSIGLVDITTNNIIPYDPTFFVINGFVMDEKEKSQKLSYMELCKSFFYKSNETFSKLGIDKSYCFYSPFVLKNTFPSQNQDYKGFYIKIKKCVNNTYNLVSKVDNPSYQRLDDLYTSVYINKNNITINTNNTLQPDTNTTLRNLFYKKKNFAENIRNLQNIDNTFISSSVQGIYSYSKDAFQTINTNTVHKLIDLGTASKEILVCKSNNQINYMVSNVKFVLYYNDFLFNSTLPTQGVSPRIDKKESYSSKSFSKEKLMYFSLTSLKTQNSLIPQSLSDNSLTNYYMSFERENVIYGDIKVYTTNNTIISNSTSNSTTTNVTNTNTNTTVTTISENENDEDLDDTNDDLLKVYVSFYTYKREITRRYKDIFEILGNIGGLSKILMLVGFFLVFYYANFRQKEALMNELYSKKTNNSFSDFKKYLVEKFCEFNSIKLDKIFNYCNDNYAAVMNEIELENLNEDYIKKVKKIEDKYLEIYLEICKSTINDDLKECWEETSKNREIEFINRIFLRAYVKYYFRCKIIEIEKITFEEEFKEENKNEDDKKDSIYLNVKEIDIFWFDEISKNAFSNFLVENFISTIERKNYELLFDSVMEKKTSNFGFSIPEIFCKLYLRSCCTKNFKERCKDFDEKYEEFLEQTDFNEIINSLQEFKTFKKTFLEKGQLWLFDACPVKEITDETDISKNFKNNQVNLTEKKRINDLKIEEIFQKYYTNDSSLKEENQFYSNLFNQLNPIEDVNIAEQKFPDHICEDLQTSNAKEWQNSIDDNNLRASVNNRNLTPIENKELIGKKIKERKTLKYDITQLNNEIIEKFGKNK